MSNFGQGFQNTNFDPSLLYGLPNGAGNVGAVGGVGGMAGGVNVGDANQQQTFNLNSMAGLGGAAVGTAAGGTGAAGGTLPQNWLNSFNNLQSQSHQLQQPQQSSGAPSANTQLGGQNMGLMGNNSGSVADSHRQLEMLRNMQNARNNNPNQSAMLAQQLQQAQQQVARQQVQQRQQAVQQAAQQQQAQAHAQAQAAQVQQQQAQQQFQNLAGKDAAALSQSSINHYTQLLQKSAMTPEMQAALRTRLLQQQQANQGGAGVNSNVNANLQQQSAQPQQQAGMQQGGLPTNQAALDLQRQQIAKRIQMAQQAGLNLGNLGSQAQFMALARQQQQQQQQQPQQPQHTPQQARIPSGGLNPANLQQLFQQSGIPSNISPAVQQQLLQQLQASQKHQQQQGNHSGQISQQQASQAPPAPSNPNLAQKPATQAPTPNPPQQSTPNLAPSIPPQATNGQQWNAQPQQQAQQTPAQPMLRPLPLPQEEEFLRLLRTLHSNPTLQYPVIEGKQINLWRLFAYVLTLGGSRILDQQPLEKFWGIAPSALSIAPLGNGDAASNGKQMQEVFRHYLSRAEEYMQVLQRNNANNANNAGNANSSGQQQQPQSQPNAQAAIQQALQQASSQQSNQQPQTQNALNLAQANLAQRFGQMTNQQTQQQLSGLLQQAQQQHQQQQLQQAQQPHQQTAPLQQPTQPPPQPPSQNQQGSHNQQNQQNSLNQQQNQAQGGRGIPSGLSAELIAALSANPNMALSEQQKEMVRAARMQQMVHQAQVQAQLQNSQSKQQSQPQPQQQQQQAGPPSTQTQHAPQPPSQQQPGPQRTLSDFIQSIRNKEAEVEMAFLSKNTTAVVPPEQAQDYAKLIDNIATLVVEAKRKSPLFSIISMTESEKLRCGALLHMTAVCSASVLRARNGSPCIAFKELDGLRAKLSEKLAEATQHLQASMNDQRLRQRLTILAAEISKMGNISATQSATSLSQQQQQQNPSFQQSQPQTIPQPAPQATAPSTLTPSQAAGTPLQPPTMLSPEMVNSMIKRPLKQEDLKPPPPPKSRKSKVEPSPKTEPKTPNTPAMTASTPVETAQTPTTSAAAPKRSQKRKASTATPKAVKKAKNEEKAAASSPITSSTPVPQQPATPVQPSEPAPSAPTPTSASTPASLGFIGTAHSVSRATHADYFAQQARGNDAAREQSAQFFASRQASARFDGDISAAMNMWAENSASDGSMGPPMMIPTALGDGPAPMGVTMGLVGQIGQTDDALADQSWHDFINENNFEPDEATPMLTRCRSLDTDPDCSPRDADLLGRSPLVSTHTGVPQGTDKLATARRIALMSPFAQPYNGMLYADADEGMGLDGFM